jgi:hypothetical protein
MSNSKKPVSKVSMYPLTAAIWRNDNSRGEAFYNVSFERAYKDDAGNWKSSNTFSASDLLLLAKVADRAHDAVCALRESDRLAQPADE